MKRKIYLLLIIIILTIEFSIVIIGNKKTKININTIEPAIQVIQEQNEIVADENIDIEEVIEEEIKDKEIEELVLNNEVIDTEINNYNMKTIETDTIEENPAVTTFNEDAFIDGHLKEYPAFRRTIWNNENQ